MLDPDDVAAALASLRRLLAAIEAGQLDATAAQVAHARGGVAALEAVLSGG